MTNLSCLLAIVTASGVLGGGFLVHRFVEPTVGSVGIVVGLLGLLAVAFVFVLRELGALDPPREPPGVLESGPDILSVDLSDRDDR